MSTETAPDSCPFCGAGLQDEGILQWKCGTGWATTDPRDDQSHKCANTERERLTRERDEARAERDQLRADIIAAAGELRVPVPEPGTDMARSLSANVILRHRNADLLARVKRLEEAGEKAKNRLLEHTEKCLRCGGSGQDNDGENFTGETCPRCLPDFEVIVGWDKAKEAKP